jgi:tRNA A-37 threonylcarbamoyl transferase component Bud32/tetratricopeptide (TPR) repeat protein
MAVSVDTDPNWPAGAAGSGLLEGGISSNAALNVMEQIHEPLKRFGPHVLLHVAGAGGMGRVQLALSGKPGMTKVCVLKRIHADRRTPEHEARFRREANVALRLSHGAIAQTFAVDEIDGELCLLQEFIQGVSVLHLLSTLRFAGTHMAVETAVHIAREVARALSYAHTLGSGGIVHRDVTPDNVMLSYSGEVKLIDFGLAKPFSEASLTTVGMVVGRQTYTAPEAFSHEPVDGRADIYSLGVVLWQMLTGECLEENLVASPWPAPSTLNPKVRPALDRLVAAMLAPLPKNRPQTAADVQIALGDQLPPGFHGDRQLADLIGHLYSVDRDREMLAAEIATAERALAQESSESRREAPVVREESRKEWPRLGAICLAAAVVTGVISWQFHHRDVAAVPVAARPPPPAVVLPSPEPRAADEAPVPPPAPPAAGPQRSEPNAGIKPRALVSRRPGLGSNGAIETSRQADELLDKAEMSFDRGDLPGALGFARAAAKATPSSRAHLMAGRVLLSDGRLAEAEAELTEAIRLAPPDDRTALQLLERVRARRQRGGQ